MQSLIQKGKECRQVTEVQAFVCSCLLSWGLTLQLPAHPPHTHFGPCWNSGWLTSDLETSHSPQARPAWTSSPWQPITFPSSIIWKENMCRHYDQQTGLGCVALD